MAMNSRLGVEVLSVLRSNQKYKIQTVQLRWDWINELDNDRRLTDKVNTFSAFN